MDHGVSQTTAVAVMANAAWLPSPRLIRITGAAGANCPVFERMTSWEQLGHKIARSSPFFGAAGRVRTTESTGFRFGGRVSNPLSPTKKFIPFFQIHASVPFHTFELISARRRIHSLRITSPVIQAQERNIVKLIVHDIGRSSRSATAAA
jgi:hypothetical protein